MNPQVSVICCTYNRAKTLAMLLRSLRRQAYEPMEVVVVVGPCTDDTETVVRDAGHDIKIVRTKDNNLARARNLGIRAAAGEVVAFIDDDAYPEEHWLQDLVWAFDDPEIAATGGPVFGPSGVRLQAHSSIADRWGQAAPVESPQPMGVYQHPDTWRFPYVIGTNALFRRSTLSRIGGFDETFVYYLEETDICLRLIERGFVVKPQDRGFVYHKYLPSTIRNDERMTLDWFQVLQSRVYFSLRHGLPYSHLGEFAETYARFISSIRAELEGFLRDGRIDVGVLEKFELDVREATELGEADSRSGPRIHEPWWFDNDDTQWAPFHSRGASGALTIAVTSTDYPPRPVAGISRVSKMVADGLAAAGHCVHVIAESDAEDDTVDLDDDVWVHRVVSRPAGSCPIPGLPPRVWDRAVAVRSELDRQATIRAPDVVYLPNWDSEGLAVIAEQRYPTLLYAYTPVYQLVATDDRFSFDEPAMAALAEAERQCYGGATLVSASVNSTLDGIEQWYGVEIPASRRCSLPLGIPDKPIEEKPPGPSTVDLLFVGRLEPRKGVDTLLEAFAAVIEVRPHVRLTLVGDDEIIGASGTTYRELFAASASPRVTAAVRFAGRLTDPELEEAYRQCDVLVAPSRFESFGLTNLEAMRAGKPVVSTLVNGVSSVVRDRVDGLLVPAGNVDALRAALLKLIDDDGLRKQMGLAGRARFEACFEIGKMIDRLIPVLTRLAQRVPTEDDGSAEDRAAERQRRLLEVLRCPACRQRLTIEAGGVTVEGRVKSARLICSEHGEIGSVRGFQVDLIDRGQRRPLHYRKLPRLGERRLSPGVSEVGLTGAWRQLGEGWTSDQSEGLLQGQFVCTDIRVRLLLHPGGGRVRLRVDAEEEIVLETHTPEGQFSRIIDVGEDMPFGLHELRVEAEVAKGETVVVQEIVLWGPEESGGAFPAPTIFARTNPYSPTIERWLQQCAENELILECGGGDRRNGDANRINMEFLPFEGPDLRADIYCMPFADTTFDFVFSQAVFEHLDDPFQAARELVRVCRPGGLILTEAAFMQPLHAVPSHFYNMTVWGVERLFKDSCDIVEADWFGPLSFTMRWLLDASGVSGRLTPDELQRMSEAFARFDSLISHDDLRAVASGVFVVARKRLSAAATPV